VKFNALALRFAFCRLGVICAAAVARSREVRQTPNASAVDCNTASKSLLSTLGKVAARPSSHSQSVGG